MKTINLSAEKAKELYGKYPEIDVILKENFTDEELGLKKPLPTTWEELEYIKGYYITDNARTVKTANLTILGENRNIFATEAQAKSALAYAQLTQLMKAYNGDWMPDWKNSNQYKFVIESVKGCLARLIYIDAYCFLAFPTEELRDEFLSNFEPLIKQFYQI